MSTERFVISALEATFEKDHDLLGKQDPYVVFELGSEKIQTPPIKSGGTHCSWEESFTLTGRNQASDLQASVYNKNTLRPDGLLGMATHRILHKVEPGKLKMELTDKKGTNTGEISFILQASGGRFAQSSGTGTGTGTGTTSSQHGIGSGTGTGAGLGAGAGAGALAAGAGSGRGTRTGTGSEESRNQTYESSTASGARSGATGATGAGMSSGAGYGQTGATSGTGAGYGQTGATSGTGAGYGQTGGVTEGVRGLNITDRSGYGEGTGTTVNQTHNPICDTKYYTKIEDRPIVKEVKTYVREHHPVEKEFVVETRPTGQEREQTSGRSTEVVDTKERIVEVTQPDPCGGVPTGAGGVTGGKTGTTTGTGAGYGTGTGAGHKGQEYDQSGGQVDDRSMMQKVGDAVKPGSQVGQHGTR